MLTGHDNLVKLSNFIELQFLVCMMGLRSTLRVTMRVKDTLCQAHGTEEVLKASHC